jgi:2-oxoglutarate dehydrogenase E2 component (dihydrolipoamide succinyltransferase)
MGETVKVVIPTIGESVNEGTIGRWFFKEGDVVSKDQTLFELDSDKATLEVPASASGKLSILVEAGKTATVGATVAMIEISEGLSAAKNNGSSSKSKVEAKQSSSTPTTTPTPQKATSTTAATASPEALKTLSPSKRKAYREGTFKIPSGNNPFEDDTATQVNRVPMTTIRKKIAARLVESQQTTATLTTFNEIDMTNIMELRKTYQDQFFEKHGVKLGFMSAFVKASCAALKE